MTGDGTGAVRLRRAEPRDREALVALYATTRERELAALPWDESVRTAFVTQQFDAQDRAWRAAHPDARFEVVVHDDTVVGRLYVDHGRESLHVIDIALLPEYRGHGIGGRLLGELAREADTDGIPLTLHVERSNPAARLYARMGFELVEDLGVYLLLRRPVSGL